MTPAPLLKEQRSAVQRDILSGQHFKQHSAKRQNLRLFLWRCLLISGLPTPSLRIIEDKMCPPLNSFTEPSFYM